MYNVFKLTPFVFLVAACVETSQVDGGAGRTSDGQPTTGTVSTRANGTNVVSVSLPGATCTAVFDDGVDRESSPFNCTDGDNGTATLRLDAAGAPRAVAYFRGLSGSGTVTF